MILMNDELNPIYGAIPHNTGFGWAAGHAVWVFSQITNVTLTAAAAASIISTTSALSTPNLPAGYMNVLGRTLRTKVAGYITTGGTAGTVTVTVKLGSSIIGTSAAIVPVVSQTNKTFTGEIVTTCKATNVAAGTGLLDTFGLFHFGVGTVANEVVSIQNGSVSGTQAPGTQQAIDQTLAYLYDVQWTPSNALHTLVVTNVSIVAEF